jgi:heme oxygenase
MFEASDEVGGDAVGPGSAGRPGSACPSDPFLVLRDRTAEAHRRLERRSPLARDDLDRDGYVRSLRALHAVHRVVEASPGAVLRPRVPDLAADLVALGADPADQVRAPGPVLTTPAAAVGAAYVLEGAALGARTVLDHVRSRLGPATPTRYLVGAGTTTGRVWLDFRARHRATIAEPEALAAAVEAATATFVAVEEAMGP